MVHLDHIWKNRHVRPTAHRQAAPVPTWPCAGNLLTAAIRRDIAGPEPPVSPMRAGPGHRQPTPGSACRHRRCGCCTAAPPRPANALAQSPFTLFELCLPGRRPRGCRPWPIADAHRTSRASRARPTRARILRPDGARGGAAPGGRRADVARALRLASAPQAETRLSGLSPSESFGCRRLARADPAALAAARALLVHAGRRPPRSEDDATAALGLCHGPVPAAAA